jgi:hypothetical protein
MDEKVQQEVDLIVEHARTINTETTEDLITFVRIAVAASDRLLAHVSNLSNVAVNQQAPDFPKRRRERRRAAVDVLHC